MSDNEQLTLATKALTVEAIGQPQSLHALRETVNDLDAVVWGRLDRRKGRKTQQWELLRVADLEPNRLGQSTIKIRNLACNQRCRGPLIHDPAQSPSIRQAWPIQTPTVDFPKSSQPEGL